MRVSLIVVLGCFFFVCLMIFSMICLCCLMLVLLKLCRIIFVWVDCIVFLILR